MTDSHPILLYDGTCGLCHRTVQFILRHDRTATLRFASLGGEFGRDVLKSRPELSGIDSVVWFDPNGGDVATRSGAVLRIARYLGGIWRLALVLAIIPRPLRDGIYDIVARHRHRIIGQVPAPVLTVESGERFLD